MAQWMIYGAYGYTGELLAEEALRRGHRPVLAGRTEAKLAPLAERLGLETRMVGLTDHSALVRALADVDLVLHAAGPFVRTSEPMIRACLEAGTHYLDITGEVPVFENTFSHDATAKAHGIALMSGVGFDVVPTDCLARYVADRLPGATRLELAFAALPQVSPGTMKSMVEGAGLGGLARRNGELVSLPIGRGVRTVQFTRGSRTVMAIPWGDLSTAYRTTGIPHITTYMAYPRRLARAANLSWPLLAAAQPMLRFILGRPSIKQRLEQRIDANVEGPDAETRRHGRCQIWARVENEGGEAVEAWLETVEGYRLTAVAGVLAAERILAGTFAGALTPAESFGADFVLEIEGTQRFDSLPAQDGALAGAAPTDAGGSVSTVTD